MTRLAPPLRPVDAESPDPIAQLFAFRVGSEEYAIDLRRVEEILRPPKVMRIPQAPAHIHGVVNLRGAILPVIDLRARLHAGPPALGSRPKCMICRLGRERVAILVDGLSEVIRLPRSDLKPAPALLATAVTPYVIGVCGSPDKLTLLLDLKALFESEHPHTEAKP